MFQELKAICGLGSFNKEERKMKKNHLSSKVVLAAAFIGLGAAASGAQETLRSLAEERGRYVGAILNSQWFGGGLPAQYEQIHKSEFNAVVAENEMKFDATEPSQNNFNFNNGDKMINYAKQNGMRARGHALAWHSQVPGWVNSHQNKQELLGILKNHIEKTVTHFKGKVDEWDVVNEAVNDNDPHDWRATSTNSRPGSVWFDNIGAEFLDSAFVWTHQYDPDAELCYNDYNLEQGIEEGSKAGFVLKQVKRWKEMGIPITCVGSQTHVEDITTAPEFTGAAENLRAFAKELAKLGVKLNITELDIGIKSGMPVDAAALARQGQFYREFMDVFLEEPNMGEFVIWGVSDKWSWLGGLNRQAGLIFDDNLQKKPAYDSLIASLKAHPVESVRNPYTEDFTKPADTAKVDTSATDTALADTSAAKDSSAVTDSAAVDTTKAPDVADTTGAAKDTTIAGSQDVADSIGVYIANKAHKVSLDMNLAGRTLSVYGASNAKVELFNLQGTPVFSANAKNGSVSLDKMNSGLYVVRVSAGSNNITRRVVLK